MSSESTPTITEADIARIRQRVRSSALEVESLIVANQLMAARIAELERLLERASGRATVPRHGLRYAEAADLLAGIPGETHEKVARVGEMLKRRRA